MNLSWFSGKIEFAGKSIFDFRSRFTGWSTKIFLDASSNKCKYFAVHKLFLSFILSNSGMAISKPLIPVSLTLYDVQFRDTLINLHLFCPFTNSSCTTVNNHSFSIQCKPQFPQKVTSPGMIFIPQPIASINPLLIENLSGSNPRIA